MEQRNDKQSMPCEWKMESWNSESMRVYSDWKIIVNGTATYDVQRFVLGKGPRKSGYFETLFASSLDTTELQQRTSRIDLDEASAKLVPVMLDFIYTAKLDDMLEPHALFSLFGLAEYFEIATLKEEIKILCWGKLRADGHTNFDVEQMTFFLSHTEENTDLKDLYGALIQFFATNVDMITASMAARLRPSWVLAILKSEKTDMDDVQESLVPHCLLSHADDIDEEMLNELLEYVDLEGEDLSPDDAVRILTVLNRVENRVAPKPMNAQAEYDAFLSSLKADEESKAPTGNSSDAAVEEISCVEVLEDKISTVFPTFPEERERMVLADEQLENMDCESYASESTGSVHAYDDRQMCMKAITSGWKELCDDCEDDAAMARLVSELDGQTLFAIIRQAKEELDQASFRAIVAGL